MWSDQACPAAEASDRVPVKKRLSEEINYWEFGIRRGDLRKKKSLLTLLSRDAVSEARSYSLQKEDKILLRKGISKQKILKQCNVNGKSVVYSTDF